MNRIILWFRNDLRLHDNIIINYAQQFKSPKEIIPVYSFDPRIFKDEELPNYHVYGTRKTGLIRANFILEAITCLRENLKEIGSELLVTQDKPESFIPKLLNENFNNIIVFQKQICFEEQEVEKLLKQNVSKQNSKVSFEECWGLTIYHLDDLPFKYQELPHIYGRFREKTSKTKIRELFQTPEKGSLPFVKSTDKIIGDSINLIPNLKDFKFSEQEIEKIKDKRSCLNFIGGENQAIERLNNYVWKTKSLLNYSSERNNLQGENYSSKLSPWLACGCISPRYIYYEVKKFEKTLNDTKQLQVFIDELFWRDFYKFWAMKYGVKIFSSYGIYDRSYYDWNQDQNIIERWRKGETGMPIIDALMKELNNTGFMPNRGRMVVAGYLTMDLKVDWRYGAYYFEEKLIDHDVESNYGGWNFSGGIGPGRVLIFNTVKQSNDHDKKGQYIKKWIPELKNVPNEYIHTPWQMPLDLQQSCNVKLGKEYILPIECAKYTNNFKDVKEKKTKKIKNQSKSLLKLK